MKRLEPGGKRSGLAGVGGERGRCVPAATVVGPISGSVGAGGDFTGSLSLDVVDGQAVSGGGSLSIYGLSDAQLVLIGYTTPDIILHDDGLLGFAGNDGTHLFGLDTAYPIDANGLLFDVGTSTAEWGQHPAVRPGGRMAMAPMVLAFTGVVMATRSTGSRSAPRWSRRAQSRNPPPGRCWRSVSASSAAACGRPAADAVWRSPPPSCGARIHTPTTTLKAPPPGGLSRF